MTEIVIDGVFTVLFQRHRIIWQGRIRKYWFNQCIYTVLIIKHGKKTFYQSVINNNILSLCASAKGILRLTIIMLGLKPVLARQVTLTKLVMILVCFCLVLLQPSYYVSYTDLCTRIMPSTCQLYDTVQFRYFIALTKFAYFNTDQFLVFIVFGPSW